MIRLCVFSFVTILLLAPLAGADDWPQWWGAQRDGVWRDAGLVGSLPDELDYAWRTPCDRGYAGPAVADGRVYLSEYTVTSGDVTNNPGGRDKIEGVERVRCLDAATGEELWRHEYDRPYFVSYPEGPRCTPTVDGDRVYTLGTEGDLFCLSVADGSVLWSKSFADDYGVETPQWGHSAHPLVDGDTLYCVVGGEGSAAVAFDKFTGEERWRSLDSYSPGYCPPSMIEHRGDRQLVIYLPTTVTGLDPTTGEPLWDVPFEPAYEMSIGMPQKEGDVMFATGHGGVSVAFRLPATRGEQAEILWRGTPKNSVGCANATPVIVDGVIYGCDSKSSKLVAARLTDGERLWSTLKPTVGEGARAAHGTAFLVRQGDTDRFWIASETGDLILARLTAEGYDELGRAPLVAPTGETFGRAVWWSHPAFAGGRVYARNDEEIVCVDLAPGH